MATKPSKETKDDAYDKKNKIPENSAKDQARDKRMGLPSDAKGPAKKR